MSHLLLRKSPPTAHYYAVLEYPIYPTISREREDREKREREREKREREREYINAYTHTHTQAHQHARKHTKRSTYEQQPRTCAP